MGPRKWVVVMGLTHGIHKLILGVGGHHTFICDLLIYTYTYIHTLYGFPNAMQTEPYKSYSYIVIKSIQNFALKEGEINDDCIGNSVN